MMFDYKACKLVYDQLDAWIEDVHKATGEYSDAGARMIEAGIPMGNIIFNLLSKDEAKHEETLIKLKRELDDFCGKK